MRRLLVCSLIVLGACNVKSKGTGDGEAEAGVVATDTGACDLKAVADLHDELKGIAARDRVQIVWPRLRVICGFPTELRQRLDLRAFGNDEGTATPEARPPYEELDFEALRAASCPVMDEAMASKMADAPPDRRARVAFEACDFARYGVVEVSNVAGSSLGLEIWAAHQWMLDQGVPHDTLASITPSLLGLVSASDLMAPKGITWPDAEGEPLAPAPVVFVSLSGITMDERMLEPLKDGARDRDDAADHVMTRLRGELEMEGEKSQQLLIAADAGVPAATLVDLVHTAGLAGFSKYGLVVQPQTLYHQRQLSLGVPTYVAGEPDETPFVTMELGPDGVSFGTGRHREPEGSAPAGDLEAITAHAAKRSADGAKRLVISADATVSVGQLAATIAAARGSGCGSDPEACFLPEVILAQSAHAYDPDVAASARAAGILGVTTSDGAFAVGNDDEDVWGELTGTKSNEGSSHGGGGSGNAKPKVQGKLDADIIHGIVRAHASEVRGCYNLGLKDDPDLAGRVEINFVITGMGKVVVATVAKSDLKDKNVASCIAKVIKSWTFPKSTDGSNVIVTYPFKLSPS